LGERPWEGNQLEGLRCPPEAMAQILEAPSRQRQPFCDLSTLVWRGLMGSGPHSRSASRAAICDPAGDVAATPSNAAPDPDGLRCPADGHMAVPAAYRNARDLCGSGCVEEFGVGRGVAAIFRHVHPFVHGSRQGTMRCHAGFLDSSSGFPAWPNGESFRCGAIGWCGHRLGEP
jgi:hypothetical protein